MRLIRDKEEINKLKPSTNRKGEIFEPKLLFLETQRELDMMFALGGMGISMAEHLVKISPKRIDGYKASVLFRDFHYLLIEFEKCCPKEKQ